MIYNLERDNVIDYNYHPLVYDAPLVDESNSVALPLGLVQDIEVVTDDRSAKIVKIRRDDDHLTITVATASCSLGVVCTGGVSLGSSDTMTVKIVLDSLDKFLTAFADHTDFIFNIAIDATRIRRNLGLHSVTPLPGGNTITTNALSIKEGNNVRVDIVNNTMTINAVKGAGEGALCGEEETPSDCITSASAINGIPPDWEGNFILTAGNNITVENDPENHKIIIKTAIDGCSRCVSGL